MGSVEEQLSAMLQGGRSNHPQISMANAILPSNSLDTSPAGRDLFSTPLQYAALQRGISAGGQVQLASAMNLNMNMNMQRAGLDRSSVASLGSGSSNRSQVPEWQFASDDKWVLDAKNEVLDLATLRSNVANLSARPDGPLQQLNPPRAGGLQRYHSAPSSFLESLAEFNEDAFSRITSPLGNTTTSRDEHLMSFYNDNLTPILESHPSRWTKQPAREKVLSSSSTMNSFGQFLATRDDLGRQTSLPQAMPTECIKPSSQSQDVGLGPSGLGGSAASEDVSGLRSRLHKNSLIRQSSSPAELLAALQDRMDDSNTSLQIQPNVSPDENLSGGTSADNHSNNTTKVSSYPGDDAFLFNDAMMSNGGLWNDQTSPGNLGGKRVRFPGEMVDDPCLPANGSLSVRGGRLGTLTRHQSLPTNSRPLSPPTDMGYDDLMDLSVPFKTRARRGYATHPRSIAERNRRSRISERMRKLQDLVPNMDRQTNTADMLDEAVEYVKHLQTQVQELNETIIRLKSGNRRKS